MCLEYLNTPAKTQVSYSEQYVCGYVNMKANNVNGQVYLYDT